MQNKKEQTFLWIVKVLLSLVFESVCYDFFSLTWI
jgi:hypothetical protein